MTATAERMLSEVARHIGFAEGAHNENPYGIWYGLPNQPYCDMGLSYCASQIGATDIVGKFAWTVAHARWFASRGQFYPLPRVGALVFFDWSAGKDIAGINHVGIVESVNADGWPTCIEFNTSGPNGVQGCWRKIRNPKYIVGYGYPTYETVTVTPPTPPTTRPIPTQSYHGWVYASKMHRGTRGSDSVKHLQKALRDYPGIRTIALSPSGVDGNYGPETSAMVKLMYDTFEQWQPTGGWEKGDPDHPGPGLLGKLGLRIINK